MSAVMGETHQKKLLKNTIFIVDNVEFRDVKDRLLQEGVLTVDHKERIEAEVTKRDKMRACLEVLAGRGVRAYDVFVTALELVAPHVAAQLESTEVVEEVTSNRTLLAQHKELPPRTMMLVARDPEVMRQWKALGRVLEVPDSDLMEVEHANQPHLAEMTYQMLTRWMNVLGRRATAERLVEALVSVDCRVIVDKLSSLDSRR